MLIKLLLQFVIGISVGIYGYLVPGYINLAVLQLGLNANKKAIRITLLLISLIEIPYCFFSMSGMHWLMQQELILNSIKWILAMMLFVLAFFSFRDVMKKKTEVVIKKDALDMKQIKKLLLFATFNPFQLSAWVIWGGYFIEKDWFEWTSFPILIFSLGACAGVFIILRAYAFAGEKLITYFSSHRKQIDLSIGFILLGLAVFQVYKNIAHS